MNAFTYYEAVSLAQWQNAGQIACFCVEPQTKQRAENFFSTFLDSPNPKLLIRLFQNGSNTLLFVLFSYLIKKPSVFSKSIDNFEQITNLILGWKIIGKSMLRSNQKLQGYVLRTIFTALGYFLKGLCLNEGKFRRALNLVGQSNNTSFKLNLMIFFLQAIESRQQNISYLTHKQELLKYQIMVIPQVINIIFPYFQDISHKMQVGQLINLHQRLNMSQGINLQTNNIQNLLEEQEHLMSLIFNLIKHLSQFPYNLSYSEFQGQDPSEEWAIIFPKVLTKKMASKQFLQGLFLMMGQAQESNKTEIVKNVIIGLDCICRLLKGRLQDLPEQQKAVMMIILVRRLANIYNIARQKHFNIEVIQALIACSKKLFRIYDLKHIKHILQTNHLTDAYAIYLHQLTQTVFNILSTQIIQSQTKIVFEAVDLAIQITIDNGYDNYGKANSQKQQFDKFTIKVMQYFLANLCSSQKSLLSWRGTVQMTQNKMILLSIFKGIKRISSSNYLAFFQLIDQNMKILMQINDFAKISIRLGNLFFLLSQIIQKQYLQKEILFSQSTTKERILLSQITTKMIFLAKQHTERRNIYHRVNQDYYQFGILCFIQSVIMNTARSLKVYNPQSAKLRMHYHFNTDFENMSNSLKQFQQPIRKLMIDYERIIIQFLSARELPTEQQHLKMATALKIIQFIVSEIREEETELNKFNRIQIQYLIKQRYNEFIQYNEERSIIFMLRCKLSLNQQGINWKILIKQYINQVLQKPSHLALYDLIGILDGISNFAYLLYFLKYLIRDINLSNFLWMNVQKALIQGNSKLIADSIYLIRCILSHTVKNIKSSRIIYQIIQISLPLFNRISEEILGRDQIDIDFWQGTLIQIFETSRSLTSSEQINYFAFQYSSKDNYQAKLTQPISRTFFIALLRILDSIIPKKIRIYPKLEQAGLQFYGQITKRMKKYIFYDESSVIPKLYACLYKKILKLMFEQIEQKLRITKYTQNKINYSIASIQDILSFINNYKSQNQILINNLKLIFPNFPAQSEDVNYMLGHYMITTLLTDSGFITSIQRSFGLCLYYLARIRKEYILLPLQKINLPNEYARRIVKAVEEINNVRDDNFLGMFKAMQKEIWRAS